MSKLERTNVHLLNTHGGNRGGVNVFLVSLRHLLLLFLATFAFITAPLPEHPPSNAAESSCGRSLSVSMQLWLSVLPWLNGVTCTE